jgi:hypothetical protein
MRELHQALKGIAKVMIVAIAFLACFSGTMLMVAIMGRIILNLPFFAEAAIFIITMMAANRFVLSPIEFHLGMKSLQYDPWYERRRTGTTEKVGDLK